MRIDEAIYMLIIGILPEHRGAVAENREDRLDYREAEESQEGQQKERGVGGHRHFGSERRGACRMLTGE